MFNLIDCIKKTQKFSLNIFEKNNIHIDLYIFQ